MTKVKRVRNDDGESQKKIEKKMLAEAKKCFEGNLDDDGRKKGKKVNGNRKKE